MEYILLFVLVAIILVPAILIGKGIVTGKKAKFAMIFNIIAFFAICGGCLIDPLSGLALASGEAVGAGAIAASAAGMGYLSAAISVGVGCIGGGIAVASSASTAIGALSENPVSYTHLAQAFVTFIKKENTNCFKNSVLQY